jgi:hypothetical protein
VDSHSPEGAFFRPVSRDENDRNGVLSNVQSSPDRPSDLAHTLRAASALDCCDLPTSGFETMGARISRN